MIMENHGGMVLTGENSWSVCQNTLWKSYQQSHLGANQEEFGEGDDQFSPRSIFVHTSKLFLIFYKILLYGANGFTYLLEEGMLQIFIALKNPSPQMGFNPQTWGPMASMLIITALRRLFFTIIKL
jgi:hypothetical protein